MISSALQTLIDAIEDDGLNTAEEARAIWQAIKEQMYGENGNQLHDNQTTTLVVTKVLANALYSLTFTKCGIFVHVFGKYQNNAANTTSSSVIANFTTAEFAPASQQRIFGHNDGNNTVIPFSFEPTQIRNLKTIPLSEEYYINDFYLTTP